MANKITVKPGQKVEVSGQYTVQGEKNEVTLVQGKPAPATPKQGQVFVLVDQTKHKK